MGRHNGGREGRRKPRRRGWDDGEQSRPAARTRPDKRGRNQTPAREPAPPAPVLPVRLAPEPAAARTCGDCREWFAHEEGGRGDCGHPGSGFSFPWSDTPACPFFARRR